MKAPKGGDYLILQCTGGEATAHVILGVSNSMNDGVHNISAPIISFTPLCPCGYGSVQLGALGIQDIISSEEANVS